MRVFWRHTNVPIQCKGNDLPIQTPVFVSGAYLENALLSDTRPILQSVSNLSLTLAVNAQVEGSVSQVYRLAGCVCTANKGSSLDTVLHLQLTVQQHFEYSAVYHTDDKLGLDEHTQCFSADIYPAPGRIEMLSPNNSAEKPLMLLLNLLDVALVQRPGFTAVLQSDWY